MTEAMKAAYKYATKTSWHERDRVEVSAISYHAGWVEHEVKSRALVRALENIAHGKFPMNMLITPEFCLERQMAEAKVALAAYRAEANEEPLMEGIHLP